RERYKNLCRLITGSKLRIIGHNREGSPCYPAKGESRVTLADLEQFGDGMICLAGGAASPLAQLLARGQDPSRPCQQLAGIFGAGNFYIDIQRHFDSDEERLNRKLMALAQSCRLPIVATNGVCFSTVGPRGAGGAFNGERALLDVLTCIRLGTTLDEAGRALWINNERHLKAPTEMAELFRDHRQAIAATRQIAERCTFTLS